MLSTPQPVDQYSRFMADAFDERLSIGVSTGFQAFFGSPQNGGRTIFSDNSLVVDIDIIRGNEKTAALVQRGTLSTRNKNSKDVSDQNYSSFSRLYPLGEEEDVITVDQINQRIAGETPYQGMQRVDRLRVLAANNHAEHIRRFVRMFEVLAAQSILTGKMDAILGTANTDLQYDFRRNAANTISVGTDWTQGAATPMTDIDAGCIQLRKAGKIKADMIVIGGGAMDALLKNDNFKETADNRRFELIEVSTNNPVPKQFERFVEAGFIARGRLRTAKGFELWAFTYIDGFTNTAGAFIDYMPTDQALIASSQARADRYFGPNEIMPNQSARLDLMANTFGMQNPESMTMPTISGSGIILPEMFSYDAYPHHSQKGVVTRTQTAPIFATTMTDAFVTLKDLLP